MFVWLEKVDDSRGWVWLDGESQELWKGVLVGGVERWV